MTINWIGLTDDVQGIHGLKVLNDMAQKRGLDFCWLPMNDNIFQILDNKTVTLVFVAASFNSSNLKLTKEISLKYPFAAIIILTDKDDYDLKTVLRSGATDIINLLSNEEEITETIQEVERNLREKWDLENKTKENKEKGKVIAVCSMKGGVGKTTISISLAVSIAMNNLKVAVIDTDFQSGDVAILCDIKPKITIYDWINANSGVQQNVEHFLLKHQSGVEILAAPVRLDLVEEITSGQIKNLIELMKKKYDLVIIDTPSQLLDNELVIMENSDVILIVINNDLPALKNSKILLDTLKNLGFQSKVKVVLNRNTRIAGIDKDNVESIIGNSIFTNIPNEEKLVISSINKGIPFVISDKRSKVAKSIFSLSEKLLQYLQFPNIKHEKRPFFSKKLNVGG